MKAFTIFAVLGTSGLVLTGVAANAVPEAVVEIPNGELGFPAIKRGDDRVRPCWLDPNIDSIRCPVIERDAQNQPRFEGPGGEILSPMLKREDCWEAPDGQIHCTNPPKSIKKREDCWEAPDGQIHCTNPPKEKRALLVDEAQGDWCCWEADDGQIHCVVCKRDNVLEKRQGWNCWEAPDGQIHCTVGKRDEVLEKRQGGWCCWEADDGQIHCVVCNDKHDNVLEKRQGEWNCWEAPDGQVHCVVSNGKRASLATLKERDVNNKSDWCCWEADDGQIHCVVCKDKREAKPAYLNHDDESLFHVHEKRADDAPDQPASALPVFPGSSQKCTLWYDVTSPDVLACTKALVAFDLDLATLRTLNPLINKDCSNMVAGYSYCIRAINSTTTAMTATEIKSPLSSVSTTSTTSSTSQYDPNIACRKDLAGRCIPASVPSSPPPMGGHKPALAPPLRATEIAVPQPAANHHWVNTTAPFNPPNQSPTLMKPGSSWT